MGEETGVECTLMITSVQAGGRPGAQVPRGEARDSMPRPSNQSWRAQVGPNTVTVSSAMGVHRSSGTGEKISKHRLSITSNYDIIDSCSSSTRCSYNVSDVKLRSQSFAFLFTLHTLSHRLPNPPVWYTCTHAMSQIRHYSHLQIARVAERGE
jgi:hypothetical protein